MRSRLSLGSVLFLAWTVLGAKGRFSISPYVDYSYSSNVFWNVNQVADRVLSPGVEMDFRTQGIDLFLAADGRLYQDNADLNSSQVKGGLNLFKSLSHKTSLFVSPEFTLTRFDRDLSFLDTNGPGILLGIKHALSGRLFARLGLSARYSDYVRENSYDRIRLASFLELSAFFPSQTTLRLTPGLNHLRFPHIAMAGVAVSASGAGTRVSASSGQRNGFNRPVRPDPDNTTGETTFVGLSIAQPFLILRIAQGLGYETGLYAEFMFRKNLNPLQGIQAISASEWALEQTDDDFFWEGARVAIGLKTEEILGLEIALDLAVLDKTYKGIEALDLDGMPLQPQATRADTQAQASLRVAKRIGRSRLSVSASYRRNDSNDLYFQYDFLTISAGFEISL